MYDMGTKPWEFGIYDVLNKVDGLVSLIAYMVLSAKYTISEWYCPSALTLCMQVGLSHSGALTRALRSLFHAHFDSDSQTNIRRVGFLPITVGVYITAYSSHDPTCDEIIAIMTQIGIHYYMT